VIRGGSTSLLGLDALACAGCGLGAGAGVRCAGAPTWHRPMVWRRPPCRGGRRRGRWLRGRRGRREGLGGWRRDRRRTRAGRPL